MENCEVVLIIYRSRECQSPCLKTNPSFTSHSQPFSSKAFRQADDDNLNLRQSSFKYCSSNAVLLICPLPPYVRFWCYASPSCKSSIRTFSRHPNCRNCGWRLSIDHRVTPGPGALSRLYPALARANPWCSARANHTTGDRSAHATSHSFPNLQLSFYHSLPKSALF